MEGEERDADRQRDVRAREFSSANGVEHDVEIVDDEIEILEDDEDEQIPGDRTADQPVAALGLGSRQ